MCSNQKNDKGKAVTTATYELSRIWGDDGRHPRFVITDLYKDFDAIFIARLYFNVPEGILILNNTYP